jgi:hypothetical protein
MIGSGKLCLIEFFSCLIFFNVNLPWQTWQQVQVKLACCSSLTVWSEIVSKDTALCEACIS